MVLQNVNTPTGSFYRVVNSINATVYDCILQEPLYKKCHVCYDTSKTFETKCVK